jgi:hypothetical protein
VFPDRTIPLALLLSAFSSPVQEFRVAPPRRFRLVCCVAGKGFLAGRRYSSDNRPGSPPRWAGDVRGNLIVLSAIRRDIMFRFHRGFWVLAVAATVVAHVGFAPAGPVHAAAPEVVELHTQIVGDVTYFRLRLATPPDQRLPEFNNWNRQRQDLSRLPALIPQDDKIRAVYLTANRNNNSQFWNWNRPAARGGVEPIPFNGLEFFGQSRGGRAKLLLLYPTETELKLPILNQFVPTRMRPTWAQVPLELDFSKSKPLAVPESAESRRSSQDRVATPQDSARMQQARARGEVDSTSEDDLEGQWARSQSAFFAVAEFLSADFSFFRFAREATNQKYRVSVPGLPRMWDWRSDGMGGPGEFGGARMYELTTGATAMAETLQLDRLLGGSRPDDGPRDTPVTKLAGIDVGQHPWKEMIGDKRPADEPLAKLVPDDNYYVSFRAIPKLAAFRQLAKSWGGSLMRSMSLSNRDYGLVARYERQLCLSLDGLAASVPPTAVRAIAITGSDGYLVEGSDVAVLILVQDANAFQAAAEPYLAAERKEFGARLQQSTVTYEGVQIEQFVSPHREVSLHRTALGDVLVYANSSAGIRRVIDTAQGRHKALAESLDFQYMRTIFRADEANEDGFAFLSDPYVRQLVGPASRIKRKRRTEALTSLQLATNAALFTAWETGRLPSDEKLLLASAKLEPWMLYVPDGRNAVWNSAERRAVSDVYGTLEFATPLIEIPIDSVTPGEARDYEQFRLQYLGLWRRYFDPIGLRLLMGNTQVKMEAYILPLIQNSAYNDLRRFTGNGTTTINAATFAPQTLFQIRQHVNLDQFILNEGFQGGGGWMNILLPSLNFIGDRFDFRLDDSPAVEKLGRIWLNQLIEPDEVSLPAPDVIARTVWQVPVTVGASIRNPVSLAALLASVKVALDRALPSAVEWGPVGDAYPNLVRVRPKPNSEVSRLFGNAPNAKDPFLPTLYYGLVDGVLYLGLNEKTMTGLFDAAKAPKVADAESVEVNSSLYLAPGAAKDCGPVLRSFLEYEIHRESLDGLPTLHALSRCGLIKSDADLPGIQHLLGYRPVTPDGSGFEYQAKTDDVANKRHGTLRSPKLPAKPDPTSAIAQLLERLHSLRADLRFREDGVQTTLTIKFVPPQRE